MATYFSHLNIGTWEPTFQWVVAIEEAAKQINKHHLEEPSTKIVPTQEHIAGLTMYFRSTVEKRALRGIFQPPEITSYYVKSLHGELFSEDGENAAIWRTERVQIDTEDKPGPEKLEKLMTQLEMLYEDREITTEMLLDWYTDFGTIHPFQKGNEIVAGVVVSSYSHHLYPEKGFLVPLL
jgi:Fic family protein